MQQINAKVKKWGNSLGIVLPKNLVENQNLQEGIEVSVSISEKMKTVGELMDLSSRNKLKKVNVEKSMREIDKELWG